MSFAAVLQCLYPLSTFARMNMPEERERGVFAFWPGTDMGILHPVDRDESSVLVTGTTSCIQTRIRQILWMSLTMINLERFKSLVKKEQMAKDWFNFSTKFTSNNSSYNVNTPDDNKIHGKQERLNCWAGHIIDQPSWLHATAIRPTSAVATPWEVSLDLPTEVEKESIIRRKVAGPDDQFFSNGVEKHWWNQFPPCFLIIGRRSTFCYRGISHWLHPSSKRAYGVTVAIVVGLVQFRLLLMC